MKRIQRKRTKGWRMPKGAIYVGRPTKYGNPFQIRNNLTRRDVLTGYEDWIRAQLVLDPHYLDDLKGKDLVCWCPLDKKCHVDVLLKILEEMEIDEVGRALSEQEM